MSLVVRLLLYAVCLFLVMVVYTGQKHTSAGATVAAATRMTAKLLAWSAVGIGVILGLEMVFID